MNSTSALPLNKHAAYIHLQKNFTHTKTHLSIANLDDFFLIRNPHIFTLFLQKYSKKLQAIPTKLRKLTLDLQNAALNPLPLYDLLLRNLKHIEHLKIIFSPVYYLSAYFHILLKTISQLRSLKVFELFIPVQFDWLQQTGMRILIQSLSKSAPKLTDLKIIFKEGNGSLAQLAYEPMLNRWRIKRLARITSLTLHLQKTAFLTFLNENETKFDISALKRLRKLKSLDLGVFDVNIKRLPNPQKFIFGHKKGRLFPNLKTFKWSLLHFHWNKIEEMHLLGLKIAGSFRNPLEDFALKLDQPGKIKDHEIIMWRKTLASLETDLKHLCISCNYGELTEKGAENFIAALSEQRLRKMETLSFEFLDWTGINDEFLTKLGQTLSPELRFLKLRFELKKQTSPCFPGVLRKISGDEGLTDKGISKFGTNLAENCKNLEFVWLDFGKYDRVSDRGVESLCEDLSKIESLKKVWLRFRHCMGVTRGSSDVARKKLGPNREVKFALI